MQLQKLISAKCLVYITIFWIMIQSPVFAQVSGVVNLGNVISFEKITNGLVIKTESGVCQVSFINKNMVRVRATRTLFEKDFSYAVIEQAKTNMIVNITDKKDFFEILSDSLNLIIYKNPFRISFMTKDGIVINEDEKNLGTSWVGNEVTSYKKMQDGERFIGLGEKTGPLDRRGNGYTNWNTDDFGYHTDADPLYVSIPFYIGLHHEQAYGIFFDNTFKSYFNFGASNDRFSSFAADDGEMNYYFIYHKKVSGIIESYTTLTGRTPLPPLWSLGFQQCRWSYFPDTEVLSIAKTFREKKIPADVIYLDINYMDDYKIFTWNKTHFKQPEKLLKDLKDIGFRTTVIVDPGIKKENGYASYQEGLKQNLFVKYPDNEVYTGQVWPGWCHFPDFTQNKAREWWGNSFKGYVNNGIEGFWNDMNEPASWGQFMPNNILFDYDGLKATHKRAKNIYGMQMARATYEGTKKLMNGRRPFILTRAGYAGLQRYTALWTGDNRSEDDHMMAGVRLVTSLGLSGVSFVGMDVGGFTGNPSSELYQRWLSLGAFTPFYRAHTSYNTKSGEPWTFGEDAEDNARNYIQLRYNLLPYLYSAFYESNQNGLPVARSMAIEHSFDAKIYQNDYQQQYYFGKGILVAPFLSTQKFGKVYLPSGDWFDLYDDKKVAGNTEFIAESGLNRLPVFVKGGAIIPMQSPIQHTAEKGNDTLYVHLYKGSLKNEFVYYEDDGVTDAMEKGAFCKRKMNYDPQKNEFTIASQEGTYNSKFKIISVLFHGFSGNEKMKMNGAEQKTDKELFRFLNSSMYGEMPLKAGEMNVLSLPVVSSTFNKNEIKVSW